MKTHLLHCGREGGGVCVRVWYRGKEGWGKEGGD